VRLHKTATDPDGLWEIYLPTGCCNVGGACEPINQHANETSGHEGDDGAWYALGTLGRVDALYPTHYLDHDTSKEQKKVVVKVHVKPSAKIYGFDSVSAPARRLVWAELRDAVYDAYSQTFASTSAAGIKKRDSGFPGDVMGLPYEATDFSYTVGTVPGYAILLGCALLILQFYTGGMNAGGEDGRRDRLSLALLLLGALALLGATELFPWDWACSLSRPYSTLFTQIQYPWRLVGVACPLLCIAGAWGFMRSERHKRGALLAIAALSCVFAGYTMQVFVQQEPLLRQDSYCDTRIRQYEYLYENTYKEALLPGAVVAVGAPEMTIENYDKQGTNLSFTISLPQGSQYLELPLLYYPGYKAEVNGEACRVVRGDNNVLRVYGVPEGAGHDVRVWFESPGIWLAAQGASLCGAALLALALLGMRRRKERA